MSEQTEAVNETTEAKPVEKELCPPMILSMVRKAAERMEQAKQQAAQAEAHFNGICMAINGELGLSIPGEGVDLETGEVIRIKPDSVVQG
jgi:hypothetical protein